MAFDYLLHIKGVQKYRDEDPEQVELTTEASLTGEEGVLCIRYPESDLTGLKGTVTSFELHPGKVVLRRTGAVTNEMIFIPGEVHQSLYNTQEGSLLITVRTTAVEDEMTLNGGTLHVSYAITIEGLGMGQIDYWLSLWPKRAG